ncbi:MAG TPA: glycosyltransferase [Bacteroidales bacterium]|nr:glycosyltransferase [Bacteroidales bacterium]
MIRKKNILICPLEWGLGHAARMIPLASKLLECGNNVFIGSGEKHLALFRAELEGLKYIDFTGFSPKYSRIFPQYFIMLLKTPMLLYHIIREHRKLQRIISDYSIDIVISDNRFGLWSNRITSVYVTHMPLIPLPRPWKLFERIGVLLHSYIIKKYTYCCIPDIEGELNLSGNLSHGMQLAPNARYIGILSRFCMDYGTGKNQFGFQHNTVILSGPEPQRSILKKKISDIYREKLPLTIILEGKPGDKEENKQEGNLICCSHLPAAEMKQLLKTSELIISRSGYTTIMDLACIGSGALLIPTPGQTEQEYLADYLSDKGWFTMIRQNEIDNILPMRKLNEIPSISIKEESNKLLDKFLRELLQEEHEEGKKNESR